MSAAKEIAVAVLPTIAAQVGEGIREAIAAKCKGATS